MVAPSAYLYHGRYLYVFIVLLWAVLYPILLFVGKAPLAAASLAISVSTCLIAGLGVYGRALEKRRLEWEAILNAEEDTKLKSANDLKTLDVVDGRIREEELAVAKLYEVTKKMSEGLKFDAIFDILSAFLKENFIFGRGELVVLKETPQGLGVDRTYSVWGAVRRYEVYATNYAALIELVSARRKGVYLEKDKDADILKTLGAGAEAETFMSMPLLSEERMVGILMVEDLPPQDRERFAILVTQFALEIKKVMLYETVERLAITDGLTGLYVRRYFFERMEEEVKRSKRYDLTFAFLMIDIDDFKKCNDTHGHLVGDAILKGIGRVIKENIREIDLAARYGGEEFSLLLPQSGRDEARVVGERMRRKIEESVFRAYDEKLNVRVSVGGAIYPDDASATAGLVEKADAALYSAKNSGKNIVCMYKR
jgi:diguanylate cyclase (GGDEF)-like protein